MNSGCWWSQKVTDDGEEHAQTMHVFTSITNTQPASKNLGQEISHKEGTQDVAS